MTWHNEYKCWFHQMSFPTQPHSCTLSQSLKCNYGHWIQCVIITHKSFCGNNIMVILLAAQRVYVVNSLALQRWNPYDYYMVYVAYVITLASCTYNINVLVSSHHYYSEPKYRSDWLKQKHTKFRHAIRILRELSFYNISVSLFSWNKGYGPLFRITGE